MAGNSILAWQNLAKNATITAGSAATNLAASNVATDIGASSTAWQTVYGVVTAAGGATLTVTPAVPAHTTEVTD